MGAENFKNFENKALIFKVNGHHFKDAVVITLNGSDLFDIYYVIVSRKLLTWLPIFILMIWLTPLIKRLNI